MPFAESFSGGMTLFFVLNGILTFGEMKIFKNGLNGIVGWVWSFSVMLYLSPLFIEPFIAQSIDKTGHVYNEWDLFTRQLRNWPFQLVPRTCETKLPKYFPGLIDDPNRLRRLILTLLSTVNATFVSSFGILKLSDKSGRLDDSLSVYTMSSLLGYFAHDTFASRDDWREYPAELFHHLVGFMILLGAFSSKKYSKEIPKFALLELSTILLNVNWLLREFNPKTYIHRSLATFVCLFFILRIVWMGKQIYRFEKNDKEYNESFSMKWGFRLVYGLQVFWMRIGAKCKINIIYSTLLIDRLSASFSLFKSSFSFSRLLIYFSRFDINESPSSIDFSSDLIINKINNYGFCLSVAGKGIIFSMDSLKLTLLFSEVLTTGDGSISIGVFPAVDVTFPFSNHKKLIIFLPFVSVGGSIERT
ncbi:hypothetical protein O9G_000167 [Rozella allomycis CSF55]|uniref:TLC domain-containing protein n=1 Tax=Rozella allomycis (strain CSF55) TaxID=988480 RepID=A0A075AT54_ROZAC|nr:hypothetical protein O9G_000167 [Rozella allomycis CSF55]|eukprot:EPZ31688.1 hypothetical protein O9G_000167 [Rozella allomycis CSF55]